MAKILVACEYSGIVRDAFIRKGHDAMSCDLLPTESPGPHHQGDVFEIINRGWDLMIAHPPCTHLCSSGAVYWKQKKEDGRQELAAEFFRLMFSPLIEKICVENPSGIMSTIWRKPDQIINPYQFGDPYRKRTCLWLKGLPLLKPTNIINPIASWHSGSTRGGVKKDGTRTKSKLPALHSGWKKRSLTFPGIANAMATQWS